MTAITIKQETAAELRRIFALLTGSIGDALGSLVGRPILVHPGEPEITSGEQFVATLRHGCAVARGALGKDFAGKHLLALIDLPDAVAMAGLLMMTAGDVINARRKGSLDGQDLEAFGELGNVLFSTFDTALRAEVAAVEVSLQDKGVVKPGLDANAMIPSGQLVIFPFRMQVGDYPESTGYLAIDLAAAEAWNKQPLVAGTADSESSTGAAPAPANAPTTRIADDDGLESIPAAPIRGTLAAFVGQPEVFRTLRRSCRRVGLELRRHGRGEIPNPAAHKNEIVLLDVPAGEDRRFGWCRRIKDLSATAKVVLLLHHPSRQRVTQAFLSHADVILGFPCDEMQLSQKLVSLVTGEPTL